MDIQEIIATVEDLAPLSGAAAWDRSGLQIAGAAQDAARLAVTIDPTPAAVTEALEWGASFILTHHPLYMEPRPLDAPGAFLDVARLALSAGAWLYAAHTSLDAQPNGPAGWLPRALGLGNLSVLEPLDPARPERGIGLVGDLAEAMPWTRFLATLAQYVDRHFWVLAGEAPRTVARVAVCPGSGGSLLEAAARARADVFVSGDIKYHQGLEACCAIIDVGHFALEETMTRLLADELASRLAKRLEIRFLPGRDPFRVHTPGRPQAPGSKRRRPSGRTAETAAGQARRTLREGDAP